MIKRYYANNAGETCEDPEGQFVMWGDHVEALKRSAVVDLGPIEHATKVNADLIEILKMSLKGYGR